MDKTPITSNKEADAIYMNDDAEAATVARPRFSGQNISLQSDLNGICILYGFAEQYLPLFATTIENPTRSQQQSVGIGFDGGQIEVKIKRKKSKQRKNNR